MPEEKTCMLINDRFSWRLLVDEEDINFDGLSNACYFADHYEKLGYKIAWDRDKWRN